MAYDIPDEIKYREKIIANLDSRQLIYAALFGFLAFLAFRLPIEGEMKFALPTIILVVGAGFVFFNMEETARSIFSFYTNIQQARYNSKASQKFFEIREIRGNALILDNGTAIAVLQVRPLNFGLMDDERKGAIIANYKAFLNQIPVPIQILVRNQPFDLTAYFDTLEKGGRILKTELLGLFSDNKVFEIDFLSSKKVKEKSYFLLIPCQHKTSDNPDLTKMDDLVGIAQERLKACGLENRRLETLELVGFIESYAGNKDNKMDLPPNKKGEESDDKFRNGITPSFEIRKEYAIVNGEYHRILRIGGYPRQVENGWLQEFLSKNDGYDISLHVKPSTISQMLIHLHNQIIQQTSDLLLSTSKGTPNPMLEIKKADTMRVYDSLYKGEEKLFSVSLYIDSKAASEDELRLLTEKAKSSLNAQMMIPKLTAWRMADGIKATLPLGNDALSAQREFLTNPLAATFPFISPATSENSGILFGHEIATFSPLFLNFDRMSNKHFFVLGISGSGKSYASKYLIMQQLFREDTSVYVLDPNGEYSPLCNALGGQVIELSRDSKSTINVFDLAGKDYADKMLSLIATFDIIVGGLTESQKGVLSKVLSRAYAKKGILPGKPETWGKRAPMFRNIHKALSALRTERGKAKDTVQDPSIDVLLNRVEMYCKGNIFGFLDRQSKMDVSRKFVCFDLSRLPNAVKTLMMFSTLEIIKHEITKDRKPKSILIDEGWSLLRSRAAAGYVFEFVKTSRKYNASIGFISQEIEDLLGSRTGRSILNTASVKILMRQNPSNIDEISRLLKLNNASKEFLLTAGNGQGLVMSEEGNYKFLVNASPKLHDLITTRPDEIKTDKSEVKKEKINVRKGLYLRDELVEAKRLALLKRGFGEVKDKPAQKGPARWYLVKIRKPESKEHAFLCWIVYGLAKKRFKKVKMNAKQAGDVVVSTANGEIAFEIETGANFANYDEQGLTRKFEQAREKFADLYIVVTDYDLKRRYERFGNVLTRNEVGGVIEGLPPIK